jgi:hypothetical protein
VLIGRGPAEGKAPELKDFGWEDNGNGYLTLLVRDAEDKVTSSKPLPVSLIHYALAYAADGRIVAVTMTSATLVSSLKIHTHPALVDTAMGVRIVELDRFTDEYTGRTGFRQDASVRFLSYDALYRIAWATRLKKILPSVDVSLYRSSSRDYLKSLDAEAGRLLKDQKTLQLASEGLANIKSITDPKVSPLAVKKEFYDPKLVTLLTLTGKTSPAGETVEGFMGRLKLSPGLLSGDSETSFLPPPEYQIWSGVREHPYKPTLSECFPVVGSSDSPFRFMLQVAFTSPPGFLPSDSKADPQDYSDLNPWEFPGIAEQVNKTTMDGARADAAYNAKILKDSEDFARTQRFFRLAMEGAFGEAFPLEKFEKLQEFTAARLPKGDVRTPRWTVHGMVDQSTPGIDNDLKKSIIALQDQLGIEKEASQPVDLKTLPPL